MTEFADAKELVELLTEKKMTVTAAESCTGGLIAATIVDVPGASNVLRESYVTYAVSSKEKLLGVSPGTVAVHTVVSAEVAEEMAKGAAKSAGADLAISVTGYAGPDGGEDGTPAGTVFIGVVLFGQIRVCRYRFEGDRRSVREQAAKAAISMALEDVKAL
jgi:PncC family amidohydrolase